MRVQRRLAIDRINQRDHALKPVAQHEIGVEHDRVQDGRWIGEAGGLDQHAHERRDAPVVAALQQVFERRDEVAANRTAQAAR